MFDNNPHHHPHRTIRRQTYAKKGMVATSQPLATQAGLDILKKGGNAIDAAIATAIALTVVEPTSNGIGGDAFALVWVKDKLYGLNASGPAPQKLSKAAIKEAGLSTIPTFGLVPITVPGAPSAWFALSKRFGKLSFEALFEPAIRYAEEGYPVSPVLAKNWANAHRAYQVRLKGGIYQEWFETFSLDGRAPKAGEIWRSKNHAQTLKNLAETNCESFYRGALAEKIDDFFKRNDGFLRKRDLESYAPRWVNPISINYRGYDVHEIPPNGQGLIALQALKIAEGFAFDSPEKSSDLHRQIESMKLAFSDGLAYITDPDHMKKTTTGLLDRAYVDKRRRTIGDRAMTPAPGKPEEGGTVYLATVDADGNMVSFIQSNYMGFGSGIVIPGTGIAMQNRGHNFTLEEGHDNMLKPGKRPYHTIIPGFLSKDGTAIGPFGVMGGFMQPQGHMQVIVNSIDYGMNPQAALDAPRWQWREGRKIDVERTMPHHLIDALIRRGHQVSIAADDTLFGRGQIIWRNPQTGVYVGGTETRTDGAIGIL